MSDADEIVERVPLRRSVAVEMLVDEAANQRGKADAPATGLFAELAILFDLE